MAFNVLEEKPKKSFREKVYDPHLLTETVNAIKSKKDQEIADLNEKLKKQTRLKNACK